MIYQVNRPTEIRVDILEEMEFDLSVDFTTGKRLAKVLKTRLPVTLASPSQSDSPHLLEKRHAWSDGVLIRGEAPHAKTDCSLSLLGKTQTGIIIINRYLSQTCLR